MRRKFRVRPRLVALAVITVVLVFAASAARSEISKRDKQALDGKKLIYIATVRKDGNQSKAVPVAHQARQPGLDMDRHREWSRVYRQGPDYE